MNNFGEDLSKAIAKLADMKLHAPDLARISSRFVDFEEEPWVPSNSNLCRRPSHHCVHLRQLHLHQMPMLPGQTGQGSSMQRSIVEMPTPLRLLPKQLRKRAYR